MYKQHLKAWEKEYRSSTWKGHYSLEGLHLKKGQLLDAGCGSGRYSIPLRMRGFDVFGIDFSHNALNIACERSRTRKIEIEYLAGNVYQVPLKDSTFDVVWCYGVLQHLLLKEREQAVGEFRRILRREGLLFIEVFGKEDMRYGGNEVEPDTFSRESGIVYHYFNKSELEELLRGFECYIAESRKEKRFERKSYIRHMITIAAEKL